MNLKKVFSKFQKLSKSPNFNKFDNFSKYTRRQTIARFLARYEIFKKQIDIKGSIIECGVNEGMGLMSLAHFSVTLEPYNYQRKIIGFDTFEGFPSISRLDNRNKMSFKGSFKQNYNSYKDIKESIKVFNKNRFIKNKTKINLVKGNAIKTIPAFVKKNRHLVVSSLWLDFDIYEPTKVALDNFVPLMPKGGIIIFDELNNEYWPGETRAFLENKRIKYTKLQSFPFEPNISYIILK